MRFPAGFRCFGNWKLPVVGFILVYVLLVIFNLSRIPLQWDEVNHFNGALLLLRGDLAGYAALNSFYPPLYNLATTVYFAALGASVMASRLVSVTFSVLSIWLVYKIAKDMYGSKTAVLSAILFGVMPGIVWLSSMAFIETMLISVFMLCMLWFFRWLQTNRQRYLTLSIAALAIGVLVKYQIIVIAPIVMVASALALGKTSRFKEQADLFVHSKRLWLGVLLLSLAVALLIALYFSGVFSVWIYALDFGNAGQAWYSNRFWQPIFYLIEMVSPYHNVHPISPFLYLLGFAGLTFLVFRRKPADRFMLVWFLTVFVVFTLIPNRQWRYVTPMFSVLAISASALVVSGAGWMQKIWQSAKSSVNRKRIAKFLAAALLVITATGVFYSCIDAYSWTAQGQLQIPIAEATVYAASITQANQSILVLCPYNLFNRDMVWFYLNDKSPRQTPVYQYPQLAVDAYTLHFSTDELINFCVANNTGAVMLYEYGGTIAYYGSSLTEQGVMGILNATDRFTLQATFGDAPYRILVMSFH